VGERREPEDAVLAPDSGGFEALGREAGNLARTHAGRDEESDAVAGKAADGGHGEYGRHCPR
jgi:hypothetical protein